MVMNNVIFQTGGDWDSTSLSRNGQDWPAQKLQVSLQAGRDMDGEPMRGGIAAGGDISAEVYPQDSPTTAVGIFPGRLQIIFPGHDLIIENTHPGFAFEATQVIYNGNDVTDKIMEVVVDIDAEQDQVQAYVTIYKPHWLGADEVATISFI